MTTVVVTGGAGFIGSALVRRLIAETDWRVVNVDKLTYAGNLDSLASVEHEPRHVFQQIDICDRPALRAVFDRYRPSGVFHLAAETHVDRSIDAPAPFVESNVLGTFALLAEALAHWEGLSGAERDTFRFVHVSTDEVFGSIGGDGRFTESARYAPSSPYAASKAAADHLVRAWHRTYGLPTIVTNCSNNYGPYQFPDKLIPVIIQQALAGAPIPVYGRGEHVRDWLHVDDHVAALRSVFERAAPGSSYTVGGNSERRNVEVARGVCAILDHLRPTDRAGGHASLITFVEDRPGHDLRYAVDSTRLEQEIGWRRSQSFERGLQETVRWYLANHAWTERVRSGGYRRDRVGAIASPS